MAFIELMRSATTPRSDINAAAVCVRIANSPAGVDKPPALGIVVRPGAMSYPISWWRVGGRVRVMIGNSADVGDIMIQPGGFWPLRRHSPRDMSIATLWIPIPTWATTERGPYTPAEFDHTDEWLRVTIPPALRISTQAPAEPPPPPRVPFRSLATMPGAARPLAGGR